jgi:hypothetical protein
MGRPETENPVSEFSLNIISLVADEQKKHLLKWSSDRHFPPNISIASRSSREAVYSFINVT